MFAFKINGTSFADCLKQDSGYKVKRSDIEGEDSGRTTSALMNRQLLARKRTITCKCVPLTRQRAAELANALAHEFVTITYSDIASASGETSGTFYGTDIEGAAIGTLGGVDYWKDISFTLVER